MSNVIASLEKVLLPFAVKIGKQPHVNAIKNGFIRLMPLTLAGAMFVLINNVFLSFGEGSFFYSMGIRLDASIIETLNGLKGIGGNVYNGTLGIMSLMAPFFIGMALAEERKVDALAAGLLSVAAFMTVTPYSVGEAYAVGANWLGGANIISGIIIGLVVAEMFTFVVRRNWVIKLPDSVPASVSRSFSALIPGFIILSIMGIISWALSNYGSNFHQIIMDTISTPLASLGSVVGWAYVIFVPLLWFFGIHGSLALTALGVGMHFVLTLGKPVSEMPGLTRDGLLGKWIWQMAEEDTLPLDEIAHELACQYQRFIELFGREPTHLDSHHHVHMFPQIFPIAARFAAQRGIALRIDRQTVFNAGNLPSNLRSTQGFSSEFYGEEISEARFLHILDTSAHRGEGSLEVMCHPAFVDNIIRQSAYCYPRLTELDVLTSASLKAAIAERGYRPGSFLDI